MSKNTTNARLIDNVALLLTPAQRDSLEFELFGMNFTPEPEMENIPGGVIYHIEPLLDAGAYAKALQYEAEWCAATGRTVVGSHSEREINASRLAVEALIGCEWSDACAIAEAINYRVVSADQLYAVLRKIKHPETAL